VFTIVPRFFINLLPKLWATRHERLASSTKSKRNSFTPLFNTLMAKHWTPDQPLLHSIGSFIWCSSVSLGMVFASMHQTAVVASWVIIVLASRREEYLQPLRDEWRSIVSVDEVTGQPHFDGDTLNKLTKLDSFIREVMRTKGDTFAPLRHACEDVQIGPYTVPSGALCVPYVHGVHMRDEAGGKTFLGFQWDNKEPAVRGSKDFISFGLGRWACPGRHLAVNEIKVLTYLLFERYDPFIKDNKAYVVPDPMNTTAVAPEAVLEMRRRSD
jgi:cytochrome P450